MAEETFQVYMNGNHGNFSVGAADFTRAMRRYGSLPIDELREMIEARLDGGEDYSDVKHRATLIATLGQLDGELRDTFVSRAKGDVTDG